MKRPVVSRVVRAPAAGARLLRRDGVVDGEALDSLRARSPKRSGVKAAGIAAVAVTAVTAVAVSTSGMMLALGRLITCEAS